MIFYGSPLLYWELYNVWPQYNGVTCVYSNFISSDNADTIIAYPYSASSEFSDMVSEHSHGESDDSPVEDSEQYHTSANDYDDDSDSNSDNDEEHDFGSEEEVSDSLPQEELSIFDVFEYATTEENDNCKIVFGNFGQDSNLDSSHVTPEISIKPKINGQTIKIGEIICFLAEEKNQEHHQDSPQMMLELLLYKNQLLNASMTLTLAFIVTFPKPSLLSLSLCRFLFPLSHAIVPPSTRVTRIWCRVNRANDSAYSPLNSGSSSSPFSDRPPTEMASLLPVCDYNHWLIVMDKPGGEGASKQQMIDFYIQTLAKVLGREEEAKKKIFFLHGFQTYIHPNSIGTDQIRCNLSMITSGWFARSIVFVNQVFVIFVALLWITPLAELFVKKSVGKSGLGNAEKLVGNVVFLHSDLDGFRKWCLLGSSLLQIVALRSNLQIYLNEALFPWYQRLHANKVPDLDYSKAKKFLHNHYLCLVVLQFLAPLVLVRKVLKALKGIVKLQAIIRSRAVRRQAFNTLKCLGSIASIQSPVFARKLQMVEGRLDCCQHEEMQSSRDKIIRMHSNSERKWDESILLKKEVDASCLKSERNEISGRWRYWMEVRTSPTCILINHGTHTDFGLPFGPVHELLVPYCFGFE